MDDPDVIPRVNRDADGRPEQPVVRQRLRPEGVDLESWGLHRRTILRRRRSVEEVLSEAKCRQNREEGCPESRGCVIDVIGDRSFRSKPGAFRVASIHSRPMTLESQDRVPWRWRFLAAATAIGVGRHDVPTDVTVQAFAEA